MPGKTKPLSKFVKGPWNKHVFISGRVVDNDQDGIGLYQSNLKPGQLSFPKQVHCGGGWTSCKDGTQTVTYKRIISTTKLIELEKKLKNENIKNTKLINIRSDRKSVKVLIQKLIKLIKKFKI